MNIYETKTVKSVLCGNAYVGRGLLVGLSENGENAVIAYFISGRSNNSRNRIFIEKNGEVFTFPFDESKVEDPSLIIYPAVKSYKNCLVVTNGDQTDTVINSLKVGESFETALSKREFEPDFPNLTPRISAILEFKDNSFDYKISILKSSDEKGSSCNRFFYNYSKINGVGHFISTYVSDGNPLPSFCGEPIRIKVKDDIDDFSNEIWESLDKENKISLYVRYTNLKTGKITDKIINKNK